MLPLKIETDRYQGDEAHFLFSCPTLIPVRDSAYVYFENSNLDLNSVNPNEKLAQMCGGQNIENTGKFVECLYKVRKKLFISESQWDEMHHDIMYISYLSAKKRWRSIGKRCAPSCIICC